MRDKNSATVFRSIALPAGTGAAALGVLAFSFTFPATSFALRRLDPYLLAAARGSIAAVLAVAALRLLRAPRPRPGQWASLTLVAAGIVVGFPLLSTLAMRNGASASHAAVVIGLLPLATAACAVLRLGERPSAAFWLAGLAGAACVVAFTLRAGPGRFTEADLMLFGALVSAAAGYAEGGRLAREMPGREVIAWGLVAAAPLTVPATVVLYAVAPPRWSGAALGGLAYLAGVSMFLGFFAWYAGLARAGVARASQIQLAQPLLTLVWSWLLLGERAGPGSIATAGAVLVCVLLAQRARILQDVTQSRTLVRRVSQRGVMSSDLASRAPVSHDAVPPDTACGGTTRSGSWPRRS